MKVCGNLIVDTSVFLIQCKFGNYSSHETYMFETFIAAKINVIV